jgi:hypothetical protein
MKLGIAITMRIKFYSTILYTRRVCYTQAYYFAQTCSITLSPERLSYPVADYHEANIYIQIAD